jgi:hypothetical protein
VTDRKNQLAKVEPVEAELVESLLPERLPTTKAELLQFVQLHVAQVLAHREDADFQPFFQARLIAQQFKRIQSLPEQRKWRVYFDTYGCLHCHKKNALYGSCGHCKQCRMKVGQRLDAIVFGRWGDKSGSRYRGRTFRSEGER